MRIMIIMKIANIYIVLTMLSSLWKFVFLSPHNGLHFRDEKIEVQRSYG